MRTCPKCKVKNLNTSIVCNKCGASLEEASNQGYSTNIPDNGKIINQLKALDDKISSIEINTRNRGNVAISDINMPFESMVVFMVKWVIATIPAIIILFILGSILMAIFGGLITTLLR